MYYNTLLQNTTGQNDFDPSKECIYNDTKLKSGYSFFYKGGSTFYCTQTLISTRIINEPPGIV